MQFSSFLSLERVSPLPFLSLQREKESFFASFQGVAKLASNPGEKYRCGPPVGKLFHDTIRSRPQPSFEFLPAKTAHRRILEFLSRLITSPARKRHLPTILTNTLIVIVTRKRDLKDFHFRLFSSYFCVLLAHKKREKFISERVLHPRMEERGWLAVGQENREKPLPLDPCTCYRASSCIWMNGQSSDEDGPLWGPLCSSRKGYVSIFEKYLLKEREREEKGKVDGREISRIREYFNNLESRAASREEQPDV